MVLGARAMLAVLGEADALVVTGALGRVDGLEGLDGESLAIVDPAPGVRAGDDLGA